MLPAGVKVTSIFTFTRATIIDGEQSLHISLHLRNDAVVGVLWVFMGAMDVYGCLWVSGYLWVPMGVYECLWVFMGVYEFLWVFMGIYGCLSVSVGLWGFMGVMGINGCLWASMGVYGFLNVYGYL